jgi:hypothetical protein
MISNIKSILSELRKMKNIALILLFVGLVLYSYQPLITKVVEKKIENDPIKEDVNNNVLIQQMLNNLMLKYGSDRAYIFRFHNGVSFYDGKHKNHQSLTNEVCNRGISFENSNLQNLPTSLFPTFLQEVMLCRMVYSDIEEIKEEATKISLKNQGIKSLMIAPIFTDNKFVGYIGVDYVKESNPLNFDYKEFKCQTDEIGRMLSE